MIYLFLIKSWVIKLVTIILLVPISSSTYSQELYGIINDPDGYTNVRKGPGINYEIITRVLDNEIFYIEESSNDWYLIYLVEQNYTDGYIHASRVRRLSELSTSFQRTAKSGLVTIKDENTKFNLRRSGFAKSKHEYEFDDNKWIVKIDGKIPYGIDGNYPKTKISRFDFWRNNILVDTPINEFNDLYEVNLGSIKLFRHRDIFFITMLNNSDGAGAYDVIWVYQDDTYVKRVVIVP